MQRTTTCTVAALTAAIALTGAALPAQQAPIPQPADSGATTAREAKPVRRGARMSLAVGTSVLGLGGQVSHALGSHLNARVGAYGFGMTRDFAGDETTYSVDLRLRGVVGMLDLHPWAGRSFRLTGGVVRNQSRISAAGRPGAEGTFTINGTEYDAADVGELRGRLSMPRTAGYAGIGWGGGAPHGRRGLGLRTDLGLLFGRPAVSLTTTQAGRNPQLQHDLDAEVEDARSTLDRLPGIPFFSTALTYRF